jgi:hypothetical protein
MIHVIENTDELYNALKTSAVGALVMLEASDLDADTFESTLVAFVTLNDHLYAQTEEDTYNLNYVSGQALVDRYRDKFAKCYAKALRHYDPDYDGNESDNDWEEYSKNVSEECFPMDLNEKSLIPTSILDESISRTAYIDARRLMIVRSKVVNILEEDL